VTDCTEGQEGTTKIWPTTIGAEDVPHPATVMTPCTERSEDREGRTKEEPSMAKKSRKKKARKKSAANHGKRPNS
jgi:hypothetical protein